MAGKRFSLKNYENHKPMHNDPHNFILKSESFLHVIGVVFFKGSVDLTIMHSLDFIPENIIFILCMFNLINHYLL